MRLECHVARCLLSVAAILVGACQSSSRVAPGDVAMDAGIALGSTKQSLATSLCGPTSGVQAGAPWPMRGGCPTRAVQSSEFGPVTGEKNWEADLGGRVTSSPVVAADGSIFVGSEANQLVKIDPATGAILKSANTLAPVRSSPAIGNDSYLYVGSDLGRVYRVDTTTLALQSKVQALGRFGSSPTILADGTVVIGGEDFGVYALDPATGSKKWRYRTSLRVTSSPAIDPASTVIYVGSEDFHLYALNTDGTLKWKKHLGAPVYATPAVDRDGSIYVSAGSTVYAVEPADGAIRWQRSIPLSLPSSPAIGRDGSVYVGLTFSLGGGSLYALGADGAIQWHADFGAGVESTPVVDRAGNLYFGTKTGTVVGLDATGRELWKFEAGGEILGSPALAKGGAVIIGSTNGKLFSIGTGGLRAPAGGVCDEDSDCEPDLICGEDAGPRFGQPAGTGVCWVPTCENRISDPGETERDCGGPCGRCMGVCSSACSIGEEVAPPAQEVLSFASGTFTRGAPGTYHVSADKRATAGAHQLRYEDRGDGHGRLALFEGARTDAVLVSEVEDSPEAVHRADRLVYDAADVPAWVRTGMWQVDVVPSVSSDELPANRTHTLVAWENGSLSVVRETNSSAVLRISSGTTVVTRELSWDAGARITITLNHLTKTIHVLGASHGDGETSILSIAIPAGRLAIGAKLDGTASVFGRMSELRRVAAISDPCAPDPDCARCGDGRVTGTETCDPALDAHCGDDCSAVLAELASCLEDSECPIGQVCGRNFNATHYGGSELSSVCWPAFCESDPALGCGTTQSPCGICLCSPNCTGQSCGSTAGDGCGDACTGLCDQGDTCTQDSDCGVGQSCGMGNGAGFGKAQDENVCWDMRCEIGGAPGLDCGTWACAPQCDTRTCGDDGCGGSCGSCDGACVEGQCVEAYLFAKSSFLPFPLERADPDPVGTLPGSASVGPLGTAEYSIPLQVPPAPGDMQPHLSLRYSSGLGNGLLGLGWTIAGPELSVIARCPRTSQDPGGAHPVVYAEDEKFCLDGTPLVLVGALPAGDYGANVVVREYRTALDGFSRVSAVTRPMDSYPSHWVVTTKDGRRLSYGTQASSRILHKKLQDSRTEIAQAWAVDTVVDRSGNELRVAYERNPSSVGTAVQGGDLLPSVIRYGKLWQRDGRLVSDRTVTFVYEDLVRPDAITGYRGGQRFRRSKRLTSVVTTLEDTRIPRQFTMGRSYWFRYRSRPARQGLDALDGVGRPITEPSRLVSVTMCAGRQRDSGCLPATEFSYVIDDEETPRQGGFPKAVTGPQVPQEGPPSGLLFDMNGDGRADRVWSRDGTFNLDLGETPGEPENPQVGPAESLLQRDERLTGSSILQPALLSHAQVEVVKIVGKDDPIIASDLDLDGFDDLVYPASDHRAMVVLRSTGAKLSYAAYATRDRSFARKEWLAFDVDGDGYQDLFRCGEVLGFMRNTGHGFDAERALSNVAPLGSTTGVLSCPNQGGEGRPVTMDTDGDGVANLLLNWTSASGTFKHFVAVRFSQTSAGWEAMVVATGLTERTAQDPKRTLRTADVRPIVIDLNGDGLSDMLVPRLLTGATSISAAEKKWFPQYCAATDGCVALETWINTGDPRKIFRNYGFLVTREQPTAEPEVADARGVERFVTLPRSLLLQIQGAMPVDYDGDGRQDMILPAAPVWRTSQEEMSKRPPSADDYVWRVYRGFRELDEAAPALFAHTGDVTVGGGGRNFVDHLPIDARLEFADFDGNGVVDLHVWVPPLTSKRDFTRDNRLRIRHARAAVHMYGLGSSPDRMKLRHVTNGLGTVEQFEYAYGEGLHYRPVFDAACSYGTQCLQHLPGAVVERRSIRTPDSSILRQFEHTYRALKADPLNRTSVGFAEVTVRELAPNGGVLAVNSTLFDQRALKTSAGLKHPFALRPLTSSRLEFVEDGDLSRHPSYALTQKVDTSWSLATSDAGLPFVTLDAMVEHSIGHANGETDDVIERRVDYVVDAYGNTTQVSTAWPDGVVTVELAHFDLSPARLARWQTNLPTATQQIFGRTENGQYRPGPYRRSTFEFDDRGLLSAMVREPFALGDPFQPSHVAGSWVTEGKRTEFARDPTQHYNVTDVRELGHRADNDRTTHFEWTSDSIVPDSVRDNLGHTTYLEVDRRTGALLTQRAQDGTLTRFRRDAFGREYERQTPFGTSFTKRNGGQFHAPAERHMPADYTDFSVDELGSDGARQETFYNSLGMPVLVTRNGFQSRTTRQELTYDARGFLVAVERPHDGRTSTQGVIRFERDHAGRITRTVYPDGTSVTNLRARAKFLRAEVDFVDPAYGDTVEGVINARGAPKLSLQGARGTTRAVFEYREKPPDSFGSNWLTTRYHYGAFDGLQRIEDPEHQVTEFGRDVYNRVTQRTDPASGTTAYRLDGFDQLRSTDDAQGQHVEYAYDSLGRLTSRVGADGPASWAWDCLDAAGSCGLESIGKLVHTERGGTTTDYTYDPATGLQASMTLSVEGEPGLFSTGASFRPQDGKLDVLTISGAGSAYAVRYNYDSRSGEATSITNATSGEPLWTLESTHETLAPQVERFGNNLYRRTLYEEKTGRVQRVMDGPSPALTGARTDLSDSFYSYDENGNVRTVGPAPSSLALVSPLTRMYEYDLLDRLSKVSALSTVESFSYDDAGNIAFKHDVGSYIYEDAAQPCDVTRSTSCAGAYDTYRPHAVRSAGATTFAYDKNGNERWREGPPGTLQTDYTDFNLPKRMTPDGDASAAVSFGYDADGQRVVKRARGSGRATVFMGDLYQRTVDGTGEQHEFFIPLGSGAQLHVTRDGSGERSEYLLPDHLGSLHLAVGTGAGAPRTRAFDAFGRVTGDAVEQDAPGFTGHRHDTDLGLIDMKGRIYDPKLGRFLQPDPIMALPVGTGLNRYAYVLNNPVNFVDPWGLEAQPITLDTIYITGQVDRAVDGAERAWAGAERAAMYADARIDGAMMYQPGAAGTAGAELFGGGPAREGGGSGDWAAGARAGDARVAIDEFNDIDFAALRRTAAPGLLDNPNAFAALTCPAAGCPSSWAIAFDFAPAPLAVAEVAGTKAVAVFDRVMAWALGKGAARGPVHHLATNKNFVAAVRGGPWSPKFEKLFKRAGMTLDDALNKVQVPGHRGPHPEAYHQAVLDRLTNSVQGLRGGTSAYRDAFRAELEAIGRDAVAVGHELNNLLRGF